MNKLHATRVTFPTSEELTLKEYKHLLQLDGIIFGINKKMMHFDAKDQLTTFSKPNYVATDVIFDRNFENCSISYAYMVTKPKKSPRSDKDEDDKAPSEDDEEIKLNIKNAKRLAKV